MAGSRLSWLRGRAPDSAWTAARPSLFCHALRNVGSEGGKSEPSKQPLRKPKLPQGRFDEPEESSAEPEPLTKFPDDVNPVTKERGGPRGPEPTRNELTVLRGPYGTPGIKLGLAACKGPHKTRWKNLVPRQTLKQQTRARKTRSSHTVHLGTQNAEVQAFRLPVV